MNKKVLVLVSVVLLSLLLASCYTMPIGATGNPVGSKTGSASCTYILGFLPLSDWDTGVYKAAKNGGISRVSTVDYKFQYFYVVAIVTTVVTGE
jgi:hypothetical protein